MSNECIIKKATPCYGSKIVSLFNEVFAQQRNLKHWEWKYINNTTKKLCIMIAEENNQVVGQYSLLPTWINYNNEKILGAQSIDTMIKITHRNRGLFIKLARNCLDNAISEGISLIYGFPNKASHDGFIKALNFIDTFPMPLLINIINPVALIRRKTNSRIVTNLIGKPIETFYKTYNYFIEKPKANIKINKVNQLDVRYDILWDKVKLSYKVCIWKDSSYINWRYLFCPDVKYEVFIASLGDNIEGLIVLRLGGVDNRVGFIVDFICEPTNTLIAYALLIFALNYFKEQNADTVACHLPKHTRIYKLFLKAGFFRYYRKEMVPIIRKNIDYISENILFDYKNWYLTEGDSDLF